MVHREDEAIDRALDEVADWLVHEVAPTAIRVWTASRVKSHRGRWYARADAVADLPLPSTWAKVVNPHGRGAFRTVPDAWRTVENRAVGTGRLGWSIWTIGQIAELSGVIPRIYHAGLTQHFIATNQARTLLPDDERLNRAWRTLRDTLIVVNPARSIWSEEWWSDGVPLPPGPPELPAPDTPWEVALAEAIRAA